MAKRVQNKANQSVKKPLGLFLPAVQRWFSDRIGAPSPPQEQAWPPIAAGENVLIHSPTGSGKTFAAFLSAINDLFFRASKGSRAEKGVEVLYISPLKALNNDVERNLRDPLDGIRQMADEMGEPLPEITAEVRTGDTPQSARARMVRTPPQILITTPESLYLILTSPQARNMFKTVRTVIIDEIHSLSGTKRGTHLSLSLERLEQLSPGFQRIGLSATQRPLEEVARFLGGQHVTESTDGNQVEPRPVNIVDAVFDKKIEVQTLGMPDREIGEGETSLWEKVIPSVLEDIRANRTTLIFANSRRQAERAADRLNAQLHSEVAALDPGNESLGFNGGWTADSPEEGPFHAHHGSISDETRRELEQALKDGDLPALVGTSSLELGIDIGTVDLVVQLQSPKTVTQGLQRVGRSGHQVGETSHYKIYATHEEDLLEAAVVAKGMVEGDVERVYTPQNPLDVLSQQVIAAVAVGDWRVDDLYRMFTGSYAFHALERKSFDSVLRLVSGKYPRHVFSSLRARVNWDETNNVLRALPGTRMHAVDNGGAIVDRGAFPVYMPDRKTRIGELDEEFVYETREGDAFVLGSQVWRASKIDDDRVIVEPAPGATPRMPFWRGDFPWRPLQLSSRLAEFKDEVARKMAPFVEEDIDPPEVSKWLRDDYRCDEAAARQIINYVRRQLRAVGQVASNKSIIVETYQDPVGDFRIVVHSSFGGKVNGPWSVALASVLKDRTGVEPETQVSDDGILFRLPEFDDELPVDFISALSPDETQERTLAGLTDSALFGALFRQNAQRSLLLPGIRRGRRTPFWLQRLRSKDLLSVSRAFPDFPVMLETYRDCMEDAMDLPSLLNVVEEVRSGEIEVVHHRSTAPSPVARALSYAFEAWFMYQWDAPKAERAVQALELDRDQLAALVRDKSFAGTLKQEALDEISGQVSHTAPGRHARSATELAQLIEELGDLTDVEVKSRCDGDHSDWLKRLDKEGRITRIKISPIEQPRWVSAIHGSEYLELNSIKASVEPQQREALRSILRRFMGRSGPLSETEILERYNIPPGLLSEELEAMEADDELAWGYFTSSAEGREWAVTRNLERIQARTLSLLRSEIKPTSPIRYQAEVLRLHKLSSNLRVKGIDGLRETLRQLAGIAASTADWSSRILPARVTGFSTSLLDQLLKDGEFIAVPNASGDNSSQLVRLIPRGSGATVLPSEQLEAIGHGTSALDENVSQVFEFVHSEGAVNSADMRLAFSSMSLGEIRSALSRLLNSGLVTTDSWNALVNALPEPVSTTPGEAHANQRRTSFRQRSGARRKAVRRVKEFASALPPDARWMPVNRFSSIGPDKSESNVAHARAEMLLNRHGVVTRRAIELEANGWEWRPIERALALMELKGSVRRGYFVIGLPGIQFALPEMVEHLRSTHRKGSDDFTVIRLTDPAYVLDRRIADSFDGHEPDLIRAARLGSSDIVFHGDDPVLLSEANGERISTTAKEQNVMITAVRALRDHRVPHTGVMAGQITVREWNGKPVIGTPGEGILESAGFRRDFPAMTFDALQARALSAR